MMDIQNKLACASQIFIWEFSMKSTFYGDFHLFFTGLLNKLQISRNSLDFRTTASSVGPKKNVSRTKQIWNRKKELNVKYFKVISSKYTKHIRNKTPCLFYPVLFSHNICTCLIHTNINTALQPFWYLVVWLSHKASSLTPVPPLEVTNFWIKWQICVPKCRFR